MSAAKRDSRRNELDKYLDAYRKLALPEGNAFEQAVWCVLARNGSRADASRALEVLWTRYVDVNELRVAQVDEVAGLIQGHVRNDPDRVAALTRAFLRAIVRGQHQMSFDFVEEMSLAELRGYLGELGDRAADVALAMLIHFCRVELEADPAEPAEEPEGEGAARPRKKGERDLGPVVDRMRLLFTVAGYGHADGKGQPGTLVRRVLKLLDYAPLPPRPVVEARRAPVVPAIDDDEEGPDDADLASAEKDDDLDDDLDDLDGDYEEDEEFEDFDDGEGEGRGKRKTRTGAGRRTGRRGTGRPKAGARTAKKRTATTRKATGKPRGRTSKAPTKKATAKKATAKGGKAATARSGRKPTARKSPTRKSPAKKTGKAAGSAGKATSSSRGGGATRPRTARKPARKSPTARKSSRRR